ncbi:MAG: SDR family oxidoreductase [Symploca sp. SIO2E6]|nr:SDR family oxidoreductase [Symploca sp. SIO2E6]
MIETTEFNVSDSIDKSAIAIIGMAGRFPGAKTIDEFWQNLRNGVESISVFSDEELLSSGVEPSQLNDPNYVKAAPILSDVEEFDAFFFGYSAREAQTIDPQQRIFLESAWSALENAGYNPTISDYSIGVYGGAAPTTYLINNIHHNQGFSAGRLVDSDRGMQVYLGNSTDNLTTRVAYKLNLTGPALNIQTACSTGLVAIHAACQSLLNGECEIALAGGVSVWIPQKTGYLYQEGLMLSPDGHCRAFDAKAQGTVFGDGVGIVVLKMLEEALADGDCIHAVIKGSAVNNDGHLKVSYSAPSVDGQAAAIYQAQEVADIDPETITYIETHGTGTPLGDPIEIAALTQAFRAKTEKKGYCAIGSVKTNVGHLTMAAGVAGLIKTVLALKHKQIPPSLHFETSNPEIDFENSPFYVNTKLAKWERNGSPRRAGVSSFGLGGTNAHAILEEWNPPLTSPSEGGGQKQQLLLLSAKTPTALATTTVNLANHLQEHPELNLADVAYTLTVGRFAFDYRRIVVVSDLEDAANTLSSLDTKQILTNSGKVKTRSVAFMFSGQGSQYVNMTRELYETQTTFTEQVDKCCTILQPHLGFDLRDILYPSEDKTETATEKLKQTAITQPALFVIEYALAQLWMSWGVKPAAAIGHSIGEYVAATLAGVLSLEDALKVVACRGRLMQSMPTGSMLAVPLPEDEVKNLIAETSLEIATINSPDNCVVSGTTADIEAFENALASQDIEGRRLHTSHAYHSSMMEGMLEPFTEKVKQVRLNAPTIPFISNLTGTWITAAEATSPSYYAQQLRSCVRFADGVKQFFNDPNQILLEVGPGRTLSTLAKRHPDNPSEQITLTSVRHPQEEGSDVSFLLKALGQLWLAGTEIDWDEFYGEEKHYRVPLPTYPFEGQRYWIDPPKQQPIYYQVNHQQLWQSAVEAGLQQAQEGISQFEQSEYLEQKAVEDRICAAYMAKAFKDLGVFANPEDKYSVTKIFEQFPIKPDYKQLLTRWLEVLVQRGMLQQEWEDFFQLQALSAEEFDALVQEFQTKFANQPEQARLIQGFGNNNVALLKGEEIGQNILFADANLDVYAKVENEAEGVDVYSNTIMRAIVEKVVESLPPSNQLKIMEIGAGQGYSTNWLLPLLPQERTHYTYTDLGESFLKFGKVKFKQYPFIEYRLFDMEKPPEEQGFELNSYDLIVASGVLHVTSNMGATLERVRSLLAPGGLFLLNEETLLNLPFDIIYGLLMPSFNDPSFDDGVRNSGKPFLTKEQWQEALQSHGFVEVKNFPEADVNGTHIILGRAETSAKQSVPVAFSRQVEVVATSKETLSKKPDIADWFYIPSWERLPLLPYKAKDISMISPILVFVDEFSLSVELVKQLEAKTKDVVRVQVGEAFAKLDTDLYSINPNNSEDYQSLIQSLQVQKLTPKTIVHLWNVTENQKAELTFESVEKANGLGFYSLIYLTQALGQQNLDNEMEMVVVSNGLQNVNGEETICPEKATLIGPVRLIPKEYNELHCRSVDVVLPPSGSEGKVISQLLSEIQQKSEDKIVAYRGNYRWVEIFDPVRLEQSSQTPPQFQTGGVYLITGGLGGLGLVFAEDLAKAVRAKLILTGRSTFPQRSEWSQWLTDHYEEDPTSQKIKKIQEIEAQGGQVLVVRADVANKEQMAAAISQAQEQFGQINGVIHCAGALADSSIGKKTREMAERVFGPKIKGTLVLETLFKDAQLDFFIVFSSVSAINPNFGQVDHSAACNFEDAYVRYKSMTSSRLTISINQPAWKEVGAAVAAAYKIETLEVKKLSHPLFDKCIIEKTQEIYVSKFSPRTHWILGEHIVMGKPTLVGTAYLEIARAAYECLSGKSTMELRDVYFLERLVIEEDEEKEVRTILKPKEEGVEFSIQSWDYNLGEWQENAKGEIVTIDAPEPVEYNLNELEAKCNQSAAVPDLESLSGFVRFGSRWWNNIQLRQTGTKEAFSRLELPPEFSNELNIYQLHPALLDTTLSAAINETKEVSYLPYSYEKFTIKGALTSQFSAYSTENQQKDSSFQSINLSILDAEGTELIAIENFLLKRVDDVPVDDAQTESSSLSFKAGQIENFNLGIAEPGLLDELAFYPASRPKPGIGEVEIEVLASGLEFRNVLHALGTMDTDLNEVERSGIINGSEIAGTICSIGEGVDGFNIGDEVFGFCSSGFSAFVTTPASLIKPKPASLSLEEAVTIPVAFQTAYYLLREFGKLRSGDKILIHAAAGGVGLAAVKIAQMIGAEIFATAGKPEKRNFLKSLGIKYVMDSRSLDFVEQVKEYTNGKGVDVVLNSLAGEFMFKSLSLLAPYGRFLELGIRDILENNQLELKAFQKSITFSALHVFPDIPNFNAVFEELIQHFQDGNLSPLPYKIFPITEAASAFQYMAQAKHIGKIVLSQNEEIRKQLVFGKPKPSQKSHKPKKRQPEKSNPVFTSLEYGVSNQEGVNCFNRIIESGKNQVLLSTQDIRALVKQEGLLTQNQSDELSNLSERPELNEAYEAPQSQIEQTITQIWEQVLGIKNIGVNDNFLELGGDSLIIVQLHKKLSKMFAQKISVAQLFNLATIKSQANYFGQSINSESKTESLELDDLKAELVLDPEIVFSQPLSKNIANPKNIFLTGSTGFIGAYLLDELFKKTSADIYCLVRSSSIQSARERIENTLKFYTLWNDTYSSRIIPIVGDLSKPLFGLSEEQYQILASKIDVIYHNGAWVNHLYSYSALKPVNVLGTKELLRLASQNQTKSVHFVSTYSVFSSNAYYDGKQVSEADIVEIDYHPDLYASGYIYSKWVSENLIAIAKQRGLPACIYRLGDVTASVTSGVRHKETDRFFNDLKSYILSKIAPKIEGGINLISVEYAAQSLVYLSLQNDLLGSTFHIWSDRDILWSDLYNWIRKCGYEIEELNYQEWVSKMKQQTSQEKEDSQSLFSSSTEQKMFLPSLKVSNSKTLAELAKGSIQLSYIDENAISTFVKFLMKDRESNKSQ